MNRRAERKRREFETDRLKLKAEAASTLEESFFIRGRGGVVLAAVLLLLNLDHVVDQDVDEEVGERRVLGREGELRRSQWNFAFSQSLRKNEHRAEH